MASNGERGGAIASLVGDLAGGRFDQPEQDVEDVANAGAFEPGKAEDLPSSDVEVDRTDLRPDA